MHHLVGSEMASKRPCHSTSSRVTLQPLKTATPTWCSKAAGGAPCAWPSVHHACALLVALCLQAGLGTQDVESPQDDVGQEDGHDGCCQGSGDGVKGAVGIEDVAAWRGTLRQLDANDFVCILTRSALGLLTQRMLGLQRGC